MRKRKQNHIQLINDFVESALLMSGLFSREQVHSWRWLLPCEERLQMHTLRAELRFTASEHSPTSNLIYLYCLKINPRCISFANSKRIASHLWPNNQKSNKVICINRDPFCWGRQGSCGWSFPSTVRPDKGQTILLLPKIIYLKRSKYGST